MLSEFEFSGSRLLGFDLGPHLLKIQHPCKIPPAVDVLQDLCAPQHFRFRSRV